MPAAIRRRSGICPRNIIFQIIEDASDHALGGSYNGLMVGNCKYSLATVFSFHPVKILTTGEGGAITTNDKKLANKISLLRSHGITKNPKDFESDFYNEWTYEQQLLGYNYRMSDIHASLGISQLKRLDKIIHERNKQYKYYQNILKDLPVTLLEIPPKVKSSIHLAIIKLANKDPIFHKTNIFRTQKYENWRTSSLFSSSSSSLL